MFNLSYNDVFPGGGNPTEALPPRPNSFPGNRDVSKKPGDSASAENSAEDKASWRDMEGPSYYCAYLGFSPISKPPTNIGVLQNPIRDLYFKYRKTPATGRSASLKLIQQGVLVVLYEDGAVKAELFFEFSSFNFVEAAKFLPLKTSSERKPKAMFVPVDESKGPLSDKNAFLLDKGFHFLVSSSHPPLVVCVVRRPSGVKALDCHVFALDTIENALHITALINSMQAPAGPVGRGDGGDAARGKASFDRGSRGDVIRTEYGEYSVYRGPHGFEGPPPQRGGPPPGHGQMVPPMGAQPGQGGPAPGPIILTQDNFREPPMPNHQQFEGGPLPGYGMMAGGPQGGPYRNRPDVIMHVRQTSRDSAETSPLDRSFNSAAGSDHSAPAGARMRYDEVQMRNGNLVPGGQIPPNRLSGGQPVASGKISPRPQEVSPLPSPRYSGGSASQFPSRGSDPISPGQLGPQMGGMNSPRSPGFSPTGQRGFDGGGGGDFGPVFSASNLESRRSDDLEPEEPNVRGKPVAKVPPHLKAGVKVLPSDFRMVKLKPKVEKPSDTSEEPGYDNNKDIMEKYKELQENERDTSYQGGMKGRPNNYPDGDGFRDFADPHRGRNPENHNVDFMSHWNESVKEHGEHRGGHFPNRPSEDNNNKNRYSVPSYGDDGESARQWGGGQKSQSSYDMGRPSKVPTEHERDARTKDLEIANMFSNFRIQGGNSGPDPMFRQPRDRNEFEEGLGYLP